MAGQNMRICVFEKFNFCKKKDCKYFHPSEVCDENCDIKKCLKKHPQTQLCMFYTMFDKCKHEMNCKFRHQAPQQHQEVLSSTIQERMKREYELKLNEMEMRFEAQLTWIRNECQHLKEVCEKQEKVINDLKNHDEPMLLEVKDVDYSSRKRLSRVISDFNVDNTSAIFPGGEGCQKEENTAVKEVSQKRRKNDDNPDTINKEFTNIKFLHDEASKIKEFVRKEKMTSKGVSECKEKLKHLKLELKKRGCNNSVEKILVGIFNGLCDKVDKILYKNFKKETTVEFERFLVLCKKEKLKVWNEATKINNMKI